MTSKKPRETVVASIVALLVRNGDLANAAYRRFAAVRRRFQLVGWPNGRGCQPLPLTGEEEKAEKQAEAAQRSVSVPGGRHRAAE